VTPVIPKSASHSFQRWNLVSLVLKCSDLGVTSSCCEECIAHPSNRTPIYPVSLFGRGPDYGMGIRAEVCCNHIHRAKVKLRSWWLEQYLRRNERFNEGDIQRALGATPETFYRVWGEIHLKSRTDMPAVAQKRKAHICPNCERQWDEVVCQNCGYN
jgi:hypothetical protein